MLCGLEAAAQQGLSRPGRLVRSQTASSLPECSDLLQYLFFSTRALEAAGLESEEIVSKLFSDVERPYVQALSSWMVKVWPRNIELMLCAS
jgi:hypothetical protein